MTDNVRYLPTAPDPLDGEVVTEDEWREQQRQRAAGRRAMYRRDVVLVVQTTRTVATHERTRTVIRHATYVAVGGGVVAKRLWESRSTARYQRIIRAAMTAGDYTAAAEWEERLHRFREHRHRRRMDTLRALREAPKVALAVTGTGAGLLLAVGAAMALADGRPHEVIGPLMGTVDTVRDVALVVAAAWGPLVLAAPWLVLVGLWHIGRTQGNAPRWLATAAEADVDAAIDETTIARALSALRIPQVSDYLKTGAALQYLTPCRRDGRGTHAVIRLPHGVTADRIARRRADFATGLHRLAKEVWPTTGSEAGILDLWIADKGALAEGAGPYPLLTDGEVDVFRGVPAGRTLRGDPITAPMVERNTITGGMPGQGKSTAARTLMLGAALDPTAELRIWVPDANFDFEAFRPRCSRYVMGAEEERIKEIRDQLKELHAEVQRRGQLLIRYQVPSVTRELASKRIGLHPLFCLLEEAHVAIQHPKFGKEIAQLLIDIVRLGRKRAIHIIVSTQAPTKDSMPRDVTRNCSNGIAYAVGDHVANDALLGQGAYAAGHRATELIPGTDRGTALVKGFSGERSEMVQFYMVDAGLKRDEVTPIIKRSLAAIEARGWAVPGTGGTAPELEPVEERDVLADVSAVMAGDRRLRTQELLQRLAERWECYREWTFARLTAALAEHDAAPYKSGGVMVVSLDRVLDAMGDRIDIDAE